MTEVIAELPDVGPGELVLSVLYRMSAYALVNLIDDAAMLSIVFI